MKLTYHQLTVEGEQIVSGIRFLVLTQAIDYMTADGYDPIEARLLGFSGQSTVRKLYYQPPRGITREEFESILRSYPNARIIRQLSHEPILNEQEREFAAARMVDIEALARRQLIRDGDTVFTDRSGMPVYTQNKLSLSGGYDDQDYRNPIPDSAVEVQLPNDVPITIHHH